MSYDPEKLDALAEALKQRGFVIHATEAPAPAEIPEAPAPVVDANDAKEQLPPDPEIVPDEQPAEAISREDWIGLVAKHLNECPECYGELYKQVYKGDHICEDCGLPLGSEEHAKALEDCPECGATGAKRRW